jgi:hypothetical protein
MSILFGSCGTLTEAFGVHLEDAGVVDQPVDGRDGHLRLRLHAAKSGSTHQDLLHRALLALLASEGG